MEQQPQIQEEDVRPWTYWASWVAVMALALGGLIWSKNRDTYIEFLFPVGGIILAIVVDHWNGFVQRRNLSKVVLQKFHELHHDVTQSCTKAIYDTQVVTIFSIREAHEYVAKNASRAKTIYNTRLANYEDEVVAAGYMDARRMQDEGILEAIVSGTEYHLLCDISQQSDFGLFEKQLNEKLKGNAASSKRGIIVSRSVEAHSMPLLQFIVLDYGDGAYKECLIGYGAGDEIAAAQKIFLVRNRALCDYLIDVYNVYRRTLTVKPPDQIEKALTTTS